MKYLEKQNMDRVAGPHLDQRSTFQPKDALIGPREDKVRFVQVESNSGSTDRLPKLFEVTNIAITL